MQNSPTENQRTGGVGNDTSPIPILTPPRRPVPVAAVVAVLIGIICVLPHVLVPMHLRASGTADEYMPLDGLEAIGAGHFIRDVIDGTPLDGTPAGGSVAGQPRLLGKGLLDALIAGGIGLILGRSVPNVAVFCDLVFPPLCFWLLYTICRRLGAPDWVAITGGVAGVFAVNSEPFDLSLLSGGGLLPITILTDPQIMFTLYAVAALAILATYQNPRPRRAIVAGVSLAALSYCGVHYALSAFLATALLAGACRLDPAGRRALPSILSSLALAVVLSLPVLIQALTPDDMGRLPTLLPVTVSLHLPLFGACLAVTAIVLLLNQSRRSALWPIAAFAAAPLLSALMIATVGHAPERAGWLGLMWQPWVAIALILGIWARLPRLAPPDDAPDEAEATLGAPAVAQRLASRHAVGFGVVALLALAIAAGHQVNLSALLAERCSLPPGATRALTELGLRSKPGETVMCLEPRVVGMIPACTHCDVYLAPWQFHTMGDGEIIDRAAVQTATYEHEACPASIGNEDEVAAKARFYGPKAIEETRWKYPVDYILWGPETRLMGNPDVEHKLADRIFVDSGEIRIYRVDEPEQAEPFAWPEIPLPTEEQLYGEDFGKDDTEVGRDDDRGSDRGPGTGVDRPDPALPEP